MYITVWTKIGEIDPDEPDNIPDKYQVTFQYISENPSYGTVSGKVKEVVTRPKNADGTYNMTAPVHPKAEVTVAGIGNYKFNRWSDGNTNYSAASEIAKAGFIADTTFTAYFSYSGGNSGGGSSGGGGGGSHRSTISNTSGGPGVTTTITRETYQWQNYQSHRHQSSLMMVRSQWQHFQRLARPL